MMTAMPRTAMTATKVMRTATRMMRTATRMMRMGLGGMGRDGDEQFFSRV